MTQRNWTKPTRTARSWTARSWVPVLAAAALGLSSCAGAGGTVSADAAPPVPVDAAAPAAGDAAGRPGTAVARLRAAASSSAEVTSARFLMTFSVEGVPEAPAQALSFGASGEFTGGGTRSRVLLDLSSLLGAIVQSGAGTTPAGLDGLGSIEMIQDGATLYARLGLLGAFLGGTTPSTPWVRIDSASAGVDADDLAGQFSGGLGGASTQQFLKLLGGADGAEDLGSETLRGVAVTRYRGTIDLERAVQDLPADERDEVLRQFGGEAAVLGKVKVPTEAWVGTDGLVRKVAMTFDAASLGDPSLTGRMSITVELFDVGAPITIELPPADQVGDGAALAQSLGAAAAR